MKVTVWTLPNCVQCEQTKKQFDKLGVTYEVKALQDDPEAIERFKQRTPALLSAPIVETDTSAWSGFRIDKIHSLANKLFGERK